MKRVLVVCILAMAVSSAQAAVTVDPDAFAPGTDISTAFAGVTLSAVGFGWNGVTGAVFAVDSASQLYEPFTASTGRLVFGTDDALFPHLWMDATTLQLRVDFSSGTSSVMLDFIGNDDSDTGVLYAYDAGGTLVDSATTSALGTNEVETLTVSAASIAYVIAGGIDTSSSLGLDNLQYDGATIPAPAAVLLGSIGVGLVDWLRRRRTV